MSTKQQRDIQVNALPKGASYVQLHLLDAGSFIAQESKIHAGAQDTLLRLYDWAFHLYEPSTGQHVLWDLGLSSVWPYISTNTLL